MNLEDKIQELSQTIDNLNQELSAPKIGDWYMVLDTFEKEDLLGKLSYLPGDIFKVHEIDKSYILTSKIWLTNESNRPIGLGGCRKLSKSEVLEYLADQAGIKIGNSYELGVHRYTNWKAGTWEESFSNSYPAKGFCFEEGFPCVYCRFNDLKIVTRLEELVQPKKEVTIVIGANKHKVRVSKFDICDEYLNKTSIQELKELVNPPKLFSTGGYAVSINALNIGCVKGITREEIENIIQEAEKMGLS
jgi:hypothetical protein